MPSNPRKPQRDTPFAWTLSRWLWRHEPPWTSGHLTLYLNQRGLDVRRNAVISWVSGRSIPHADRQAEILDFLGISPQQYIATYEELGESVPLWLHRMAAPAPRPKPYTRQEQPQDEWEAMIAATVEGMRAAGIADSAIAQVVEHIRQKQRDERPLQRHLISEHTN